MMKKILLIFHICIALLAVILLLFTTLGSEYFKYVYVISLYEATEHNFDVFICAALCTILLFIFDIVWLVANLVRCGIYKLKNKDARQLLRKVVIWGIMGITAFVSLTIYFARYIVWIT